MGDNPINRVSRRSVLRKGTAAVGSLSLVSGVAQAYEEDDLNLFELGISYDDYKDTYVVELRWEWGSKDAHHSGDNPRDVPGIYWDPNKWEVNNPDYNTSDKVEYDTRRYANDDDMEGVNFLHDDSASTSGELYYCAVTLNPKGDYTENQRNVYGELTHTYNTGNIVEIELGLSGFYVNLDDGGESWDKALTKDQAEANSL